MIPVISVVLISSVIYVLIKQYAPEFALLAEVGSIILVLLFVYPYICDVINFYYDINAESEYVGLLLKICGVSILTEFAADISADSGIKALSAKVEFAGKVIILAMSLPVVESLLELAIGMIKEK